MGKPSITSLPVEAYSLPSDYGMADSTHVFIVAKNDRSIEWTNAGGGWSDHRPRTLVATTNLYYEWANTFNPRPIGYNHAGINFGVNGICHTIANRVLLVADSKADAHNADKDPYCVFFYGKYGLGLKQLKQLLETAYNQTSQSYSIPSGALQTVLKRVDDCVEDELLSWKYIAEYVGKMDVNGIIARSGSGSIDEARRRLQNYVNSREDLYGQYLRGGMSTSQFQKGIKERIQEHAGGYIRDLSSWGYISTGDRDTYLARLNAFLNEFIHGVNAQLTAVQNTLLL